MTPGSSTSPVPPATSRKGPPPLGCGTPALRRPAGREPRRATGGSWLESRSFQNGSVAGRHLPRRAFLRRAGLAAGALALPFPLVRTTRAAPDDPIRIGVLGCGRRGLGAAREALVADRSVRIVALADLLPDRVEAARRALAGQGQVVAPEQCFSGLRSIDSLLAVPDLAYIIHATPPAFRPEHFRQIIAAGRSVFLERPMAVDAPGVRSVLATAREAAHKGLSVVVGTQRRHQANYAETLRRLQDGAIGRRIEARAYTLVSGAAPVPPPPEGMSDLEYQVRHWTEFLWLSGDPLVEQHVDQLDVLQWLTGTHPIRALALGGRQTRSIGNTYDHVAVEYEYSDGFRVFSYCRRTSGGEENVGEAILGTEGTSDGFQSVSGPNGRWTFSRPTTPEKAARGDGGTNQGYVQAQADLLAAVRTGTPREEATACAMSTLAAILGRVSAYTGKHAEWDRVMASEQTLFPASLEGRLPVAPPPIPGKYPFA